MGFSEDIGKKVADAGQKTVQKTKEMSDVLRLESLVTKEENGLNQVYLQIGKRYVELHADSCEEEFSEMLDKVRGAEQAIQDYKQQIEEIKSGRNREEDGDGAAGKCPYCGAAVPADGCFCTSCGKPIPQPEEPSEGEEKKRFCTACGAMLAPDAAFCENCGTKVV